MSTDFLSFFFEPGDLDLDLIGRNFNCASASLADFSSFLELLFFWSEDFDGLGVDDLLLLFLPFGQSLVDLEDFTLLAAPEPLLLGTSSDCLDSGFSDASPTELCGRFNDGLSRNFESSLPKELLATLFGTATPAEDCRLCRAFEELTSLASGGNLA